MMGKCMRLIVFDELLSNLLVATLVTTRESSYRVNVELHRNHIG